MSELQELQNTQEELEAEARSLSEERKHLEERTKVLQLKIAIEELRRNNAGTRADLTQLKTEVEGLEQKLRETAEGRMPQQSEGLVSETVVPPDTEAQVSEQNDWDKKESEKKRRFW